MNNRLVGRLQKKQFCFPQFFVEVQFWMSLFFVVTLIHYTKVFENNLLIYEDRYRIIIRILI